MATTYAEKLKDPRWQRKRLEILERDDFTCQECGSETKTLHVHHGYYETGLQPWEYPDDTLHTVCEDCHTAARPLSLVLRRELGRLCPCEQKMVLGYVRGLLAMNNDGERVEIDSWELSRGVADAWLGSACRNNRKVEHILCTLEKGGAVGFEDLQRMVLNCRDAARNQVATGDVVAKAG